VNSFRRTQAGHGHKIGPRIQGKVFNFFTLQLWQPEPSAATNHFFSLTSAMGQKRKKLKGKQANIRRVCDEHPLNDGIK
jgi:hypothetical protein